MYALFICEEKLKSLLGEKRERLGIFEGDEQNGMMEAGQGVGLIKEILPVKDLMERLIKEFDEVFTRIKKWNADNTD